MRELVVVAPNSGHDTVRGAVCVVRWAWGGVPGFAFNAGAQLNYIHILYYVTTLLLYVYVIIPLYHYTHIQLYH